MRCKCSESSILYPGKKDIAPNCFGDVGAPCDPKDSNPCIERAECVSISQQTYRCECKFGFVENLSINKAIRGCEIAYGHPCGRLQDTLPCDITAQLVCNQGICHCPSIGHFYEEDRRRCAIPVGITCTYEYHCVKNALCKNPRSYEQIVDYYMSNVLPNHKGRCTCMNNATIDATNTFCVVSV
jgi:hypothetical protein